MCAAGGLWLLLSPAAFHRRALTERAARLEQEKREEWARGLMLERREAVRMMLCEAEHFPEVRQTIAQNPRQLRQALSAYLEAQMARGQVRPLHAEAAAQAFWGMVFAYSISLWLLDEKVQPELSSEELVEAFVEIFVRGTEV